MQKKICQIWNGAIKREIKKNGERRAWQKDIEMVWRAVIKWSRRGSIDGWIGQKINGGIDEWTHEGTHRQTERWMDERGHKSQKWLLSSGSDPSKNEFLYKCRLPPSSSLTHCLFIHPSVHSFKAPMIIASFHTLTQTEPTWEQLQDVSSSK